MQTDSLAVSDTLTQTYSEIWSGAEEAEQANAFIQFMFSNDLIFVVLGVSLIVWFTMLFFLVRLDKKVSSIEEETE